MVMVEGFIGRETGKYSSKELPDGGINYANSKGSLLLTEAHGFTADPA